jgi:hypothetical protein
VGASSLSVLRWEHAQVGASSLSVLRWEHAQVGGHAKADDTQGPVLSNFGLSLVMGKLRGIISRVFADLHAKGQIPRC